MLLFTCLVVCGSWWLDHKRLERKISIEVENQRIIKKSIQRYTYGFQLDPESEDYVYELSSAEEKLNVEISSDDGRFMVVLQIVCWWEMARRLEDQNYDKAVSLYKRCFENLGTPLPAITVSPKEAPSLIQFTKDIGKESKIPIRVSASAH